MKIIRMLPVLALAALLATPARAQNHIATVNLRKVFDNYWKRQQAQAALNDRNTAIKKELKGFVDDYKKSQDEYTKLLTSANDQSVTPEERDKRKSAAEAKLLDIKTAENTIRTFEDNARDQLDSQKKRMVDSILEDIRTAVNAKAKAAGYTLVIDSAADSLNQTPVILYNNGENDMTDGILAQLNAGAPPPTAAADSDKTAAKPESK